MGLSRRQSQREDFNSAVPPGGQHGSPHLLAVMGDGGQDGAERFEAHGDVRQVSGEEEVVVVPQDGHCGVPHQIQKGLRGDITSFKNGTTRNLIDFIHR